MPARRGEDGYSKEERVALILSALSDSPGRSAPTLGLRRQLAPFHATSAREATPQDEQRWERTLDRDLADLEQRGVIERFDPRDPEATNRRSMSHVRLALPVKPQHLALTGAEHAALARARSQIRPGPPLTSPLRVQPSDDVDHLDLALMTLRYLEETGDTVSVSELAVYLGRDSRAIRSALEHLADIDSQLLAQCMLVIDYRDDDSDPPIIEGVSISTTRQREPGYRVGRGGGLNPLARFAYTRDEAEERLSLIDEVLAGETSRIDDDSWAALSSARAKLAEWVQLLDRAMA